MTMTVLGHPSFEESYPSLANQSSARGQAGWIKWGRGSAPTRKISFVFLVAYGPKVSLLRLSHWGGYWFWNQAGQFPAGSQFFHFINFLFYIFKMSQFSIIRIILSISPTLPLLLKSLSIWTGHHLSLLLSSWEFFLLPFWVGFIIDSTPFSILVSSLVLQVIF